MRTEEEVQELISKKYKRIDELQEDDPEYFTDEVNELLDNIVLLKWVLGEFHW
jgi:hypothetical protein